MLTWFISAKRQLHPRHLQFTDRFADRHYLPTVSNVMFIVLNFINVFTHSVGGIDRIDFLQLNLPVRGYRFHEPERRRVGLPLPPGVTVYAAAASR